MAVSYLAHHFGRDFLNMKLPFLAGLDRRRLELLLQMLERRVNSPLTSSCGRLFDAVAALLCVRYEVNYEAQAAIELEMTVSGSRDAGSYPLETLPNHDGWIIGTRPMFEALIRDLVSETPTGIISARFHNGLVDIFARVATLLRQRTGLNRACLSGGTFNNRYLTEHLFGQLTENAFEVFTQRDVPCGDGGLSLGQAMIAAQSVG
jgi:hydrogenase maturation protein HypF